MPLRNQSILILSPEPWGTNFVSKHHYAAELGEHNRVHFAGPPGWHWPLRRWAPSGERVRLLNYPSIPGLNRLPARMARPLRRLQARWLETLAGGPFDLVWNFDPFVFQDLSVFRCKLKIYHGVDLHYTDLENDCVAGADVAFFTSDLLRQRHAHSATPAFQINHGLSRIFAQRPGKDWSAHPGPIQVGFVGNLHYRFLDYELLYQIIRAHPQVVFNLVGPTGSSNLGSQPRQNQLERIQSLENVKCWGAVHPARLTELFESFDLFLMCYQGDDYKTELANPHKLLEYLSSGKVTVCHYADQYRDQRHLLAMADQQAELPALFERVVTRLAEYNSAELSARRREYALANTYASQIARIENLLAEHTGAL